MKEHKTTIAFFDFDGTLYDGIVAVDFVKSLIKNKSLRWWQIAKLSQFLYYYALDKFKLKDRYFINKKIYTKLKGWDVKDLQAHARTYIQTKAPQKIMKDMKAIVAGHKKAGHTVVIITSALKEIVEPIRHQLPVDEIIATEVEIINDSYTGKLRNLPVGNVRAQIVENYCKHHGAALAHCYGYSDHYSDIPMLSLVGNPIAVYPERRLKKHAKKQHWKIIEQTNHV